MRPPLRLRAYIAGVAGAGAGTLVIAALAGRYDLLQRPLIFTAFALGLAFSWMFPLFMLHRDETEVLVLDEAFLVAMALLIGPFDTLLALAIGMGLGLAFRKRGLYKTIFNMGQTVIAGGFAMGVMGLLAPDRSVIDGQVVGAVLAGAAVFFVAQTVLVSAAISIAEGIALRKTLTNNVGSRLLVWVGNVSVGLMAGLVATKYTWGLAVTIVPIAVLQLVYNSHLRAKRDRERLDGLLKSTERAHANLGMGDVELAIAESAAQLLRCGSARFDSSPPMEGELGAFMQVGADSSRWLIVSERRGVEPFEETDQSLLDAVAALGCVALANAELFEQAADERRKLTDVFSSSSDGIFSVDADGEITSWNPAMEEISGFKSADMIGTRHLGALRPRDPDGRDVLTDGWTLSRDIPDPEIQILAANGDTRWLNCTYSTMKDGGYVVVARDITAQREIEELKADFLATVSHELRTPLTPIQGFLQTLMRDDVDISDEQRNAFYRTMLSQTDRLSRLLNDLLDAVSIQRHENVIAPDKVDWQSGVAQAVHMMQQQFPERSILLDVRDVPEVFADVHRAEQVLFNLLTNSNKYSHPSQPITVQVRAAGRMVFTSVIDRGAGIPAEDRTRIFDRFTRLGSHLTRVQGGVGLGLFISRKLVEAMGGRIWVEDNPEGGSVFTFTLPIYSETAPARIGLVRSSIRV